MKKLLPLLAALPLALSHAALAQNATTTPVGAMTYTIPAGSLVAPKLSSVSTPLFSQLPAEFVGTGTGKISGVTSNTITCSGGNWTTGSLAQAATPYLVRIKTGAAVGYVFQVSANTADTLTLLTDGVDLTTLGVVTSGLSQDAFEIHPGDTLLSFFGTGTSDGGNGTVMGGTSAANADLVTIHNGSAWKTYYYNLAKGQWQEGNFNRNNVLLLPRMGITYQRRAVTPMTFTITGVVPDTDMKVRVNNGGASYISLSFPTDVTLGSSGLQNMPGFAKNTGNLATADKIQVWNGSSWKSYNYNAANSQWREGNFNRNSVIVPAGTPVQVVKGSAATGSQLWTLTMPYSL